MSFIYRTEKTPMAFLDDLSKRGFNKQLEIKQVRDRSGVNYKVDEIAKYWPINPVRLIASPQTDTAKLTMATNLVELLKTNESSLTQFKDAEMDAMKANFEKIAKNIVRNTVPNQAQLITDKFSEAIKLVEAAKLKKNTKFYATDRITLQTKDAVKADDFYKRLSNATWSTMVWGFNERILIKEPSSGRFEIYNPAKPWFYQRLFGIPVSAAEKLAAVQNLAKMVKNHREFIVQNRYDVGAMIKNLEAIKTSITRNTAPVEKKAIEKELDGAIAELKDDLKDIATSISNDLSRRVGRFAKEVILFPLRWTVVPAYNIIRKFC